MEAIVPAAAAPAPPDVPLPDPLSDIIPARLRVDVIVHRQFFKHEEFYVIKDPLALTYYRMLPEEAYILTLLDGKHTLRQISQKYSTRFPNQPRSVEEIAQYVNQLASTGLLNVGASRFVESMRRSTPKANLLMVWAKVISTVFFVKVPLLDPSPWLSELVYAVRFFWTKWFVGAVLLFYVWTAGLLLANAVEFQNTAVDFFSSSNLLLVWFTVIVIKTLHEFGHAMTCRHFGGEVHEMGVAFMIFTPCGYVDASDAWMMRHKRHKLYVTIAGIFVELILAGIAAHLWLVMPEGIGRNLAFNAMVVASVNTIIFNINPLMRFDGYYVFADLLEIPNLRTKAISFCSYHLQRFFLGYRNKNQESLFEHEANTRVFVLYAIFAYGYMLTIIYGLTQVFGRILKPYGLEVFGLSVGYFVEGSFALLPIIKVFLDATSTRAHIVKTGSMGRRLLLFFGSVVAAIALSSVIPAHYHVSQQAVITPEAFEAVASEVGGVIKEVHVQTGQWVEPGQLLVTLDNPDVAAELETAEVTRRQARLRLGAARATPAWSGTEAEAKAAQDIEAAEALYARAAARAKQLEIRAHFAGFVLTPEVQKLAGGYATPTLPFIRIGDTRRVRMMIPLTEDEAQLVAPGSVVKGRWLATARPFETTLNAVASQPAKTTDYQWGMAVHFGGPVPTRQISQKGKLDYEYPIFIASATLDNPGHTVLPGLRAHVTIEGERTTVGRKTWRWFLSLFKLKVKRT